jgi:hypothetical protein
MWGTLTLTYSDVGDPPLFRSVGFRGVSMGLLGKISRYVNAVIDLGGKERLTD